MLTEGVVIIIKKKYKIIITKIKYYFSYYDFCEGMFSKGYILFDLYLKKNYQLQGLTSVSIGSKVFK